MNAIKMLKQQHREVEKLFKKLTATRTDETRRTAFEEIADALAVHATIEERHFYPGVKKQQTEDLLLESVEEHLEVKRLIADLMEMDAGDDQFEAKATVLQENVEHHVEEEEGEMFPKARKVLSEEEAEELGTRLEAAKTEQLKAAAGAK